VADVSAQTPTAAALDVREEIARAPVGGYHVQLTLLVGLIVFFEGYDTFNAAYVLHYVVGPWGLRPGQAGLLISSAMVGFMIGALAQGKASDRFGRRSTLLAALWVATAFSLVTAGFARSFATFCALRLLTGIGLGTLLPVSVAYLNEFAPARLKHSFATWGWGLGFSLGGIAASVVGIFLTPSWGWPVLYYVASLSALLAVACHAALPESPQFLALRGRHADIARVLTRLHPARAAAYAPTGVRFVLPEPGQHAGSVSLLFAPQYRRTTLSAWAAAFFALFSIYGLTGWVPTAMMQRGETFAASFAFGAVILAMNFVGTLACGAVINRRGAPHLAIAAWWACGAIAIAILGLANVPVLNGLCLAAAGFFVLGGQGALNNATASWYATEVRGTALGWMLGVGRLGGILGPVITGALKDVVPGAGALFGAIAAAAMAGAVSIVFAVARHGGTRASAARPA
jgi:AAHS family 4-hydroxybenzoate transporter-like MFS transporter